MQTNNAGSGLLTVEAKKYSAKCCVTPVCPMCASVACIAGHPLWIAVDAPHPPVPGGEHAIADLRGCETRVPDPGH